LPFKLLVISTPVILPLVELPSALPLVEDTDVELPPLELPPLLEPPPLFPLPLAPYENCDETKETNVTPLISFFVFFKNFLSTIYTSFF
jgi:hypothetical protein